jgi:amidase
VTEKLIKYDAIALGELNRKGEISPVELLDSTIQRIEKVNPTLNAVIHKMYDLAHDAAAIWSTKIIGNQAMGTVFCGVPFLLKDLLAECENTPFSEGSKAVNGYISKLDTELVKRQKVSGLIIVGKTNTSEFGGLPLADCAIFGPTLNPWDPGLNPGGSSGGAAAVAAGITPMAHCSDGGGSIRIPASCCGLFGLKPTRGRNPLGPYFGDLASGLVSEHALTRTVRDSAALLDVTSGPAIGDPYYAPAKERPFLEEVNRDVRSLKIGFLTSAPEGWGKEPRVHSDCLNAVRDAARLCEDLGHIVEEIVPDELSDPHIQQHYNVIWSSVIGHFISYWERELGRKFGPDEIEPLNWEDYQAGFRVTGADYLVTQEQVQYFSRKIVHWYHDGSYDLLLTPTLRIPPSSFGTFNSTKEAPKKLLDVATSFNPFTRIQNLTGQPAMSVPLFWNEDNVPIGVHFAGRFGDEATLFRLAAQLEQARPWADRKPPIHCSNLS